MKLTDLIQIKNSTTKNTTLRTFVFLTYKYLMISLFLSREVFWKLKELKKLISQ